MPSSSTSNWLVGDVFSPCCRSGKSGVVWFGLVWGFWRIREELAGARMKEIGNHFAFLIELARNR